MKAPPVNFLLFLFFFLLAGCRSFQGSPKPLTDTEAELAYLKKWFNPEQLGNYDEKDNESEKKKLRNQIIEGRLRAVDLRYEEFIRLITAERNLADIGTDWTVIALNATAAVTGTATTKSILAAMSGGIVGAKSSFDKNLYFEKTKPALIAQMEARRKESLISIRQGLQIPTYDYSLNQGLNDVDAYFRAGTIPGAVVAFVEEAGSSSKQASLQLQDNMEADLRLDPSIDILSNFWMPNGIVDLGNQTVLTNFLESNNLSGDELPTIINFPQFRDFREFMIQELDIPIE